MRAVKDYEPFLSAVLSSVTSEAKFEASPNLAEILHDYPQTVVAFNQATPLGWLPAVSMLAKEVAAAGGGERIPTVIMDRFFYKLPLMRPLERFITQSSHSLRFEDLVETFQDGTATDLLVFPEGSNVFTGELDSIHDFRSSRFVEFATRMGYPILLAVHRGSENWALPAELPSFLRTPLMMTPSALIQKIALGGRLNLPWPSGKIPSFQMHCEVWTGHLQFRKLPFEGEEAQKKAEAEAAKIRDRMSEIYAAMGGDSPTADPQGTAVTSQQKTQEATQEVGAE
ncbi:MAG: hypothetical protein KF802_10775 [Bdellovibrionaceae bacterium]|nr:hypothetical protein [Pseudobdellovibrionaceae bacterium]MBX3034604.1 hypothetical protein [Pseudobdellovibrionaceae bacterium]